MPRPAPRCRHDPAKHIGKFRPKAAAEITRFRRLLAPPAAGTSLIAPVLHLLYARIAGEPGYFFSPSQMLRYCTLLPWPWKWMGRGPGPSPARPPLLRGSSPSWITTPLCRTVILALAVFLPAASYLGAVNSTSYVCQTSGARHMFTAGGLML